MFVEKYLNYFKGVMMIHPTNHSQPETLKLGNHYRFKSDNQFDSDNEVVLFLIQVLLKW